MERDLFPMVHLRIQVEHFQRQLLLVCHNHHDGILDDFDQLVMLVERYQLGEAKRCRNGEILQSETIPRLAVFAPSGLVGRLSVAGTISGGKFRYSRK